MPAGLPGDSLFNNQGNPNAGNFVVFDPLSGPKDAPLDAKKIDYSTGTPPGWAPNRIPIKINDDANISTGALSTGIGVGGEHVIGLTAPTDPESIFDAGFNDNQEPGTEPTFAAPPPNGVVAANTVDSTRMYIGGGRMEANPDADTMPGVPFIPDPYTAGIAFCGAGNGGSRDGGANTGFGLKMVTAAGAVANGAAVEAGFVNRSGVALVANQSLFGSAVAALPAAA